jgi:hypothetical protein
VSLGFDFSFGLKPSDIFSRGLKELLSYTQEHKATYIAEQYVSPTGFKLGVWQKGMRYRHKQGKLPQEIVKKLTKARFLWESNYHQKWFAFALEKTALYKKEHGNINVPYDYRTPEGYWRGGWQSRMRCLRRKNRLSPEKIEALDRLGLLWQTPGRYAKFQKGLMETRRYKKASHRTNAPFGYKTPEGFRLGVWQQGRKRKYRGNKLSQEQIKSLRALGFNLAFRQIPGVGIPGGGDSRLDATLPHAQAESDLHGRYPGEETSGPGRSEESVGISCQRDTDRPQMVETGRVAEELSRADTSLEKKR